MLKFFPHQVKTLEFLLERKRAIVCSAPRTGKSLPAMAAAMQHQPALVVCPAIIRNVLKRACEAINSNIPVTIIEGRKAASELVAPSSGIVIMSYDITPYITKFDGFQCLVLDEAHRIANNTAKRTKACMKLMKATPNVYALTGTPIPRHPIGLWPLLSGLGIYKKSWMDFALRYCGGWSAPWGFSAEGATNIPELREKLKPHIIRHTKEDVFKNYTAPQFSLITFDLPLSRQEQGLDMDALVNNPNLILALEGLSELLLESARRKIKNCIEFVEDLLAAGEPVIVFAVHKEIVAAMEAGLKHYGVVKVVGDTPKAEREKAISDFQAGKADVIIGAVTVLAEGVDLSRSDTIVFVETGWSPAAIEQCSSRVENINKESTPVVYILTTANSLDHRVMSTILKKQNIIDQIL